MYEKNLSLALIMTTALIGVLFMVLTQTVIPHFFRQPGYLYEKQYFKAEPILLSKPKSKKAKVKKTKKGTKK
jgi:phosphatidylglycerol:prolipoprotein diacylglycerol transferase